MTHDLRYKTRLHTQNLTFISSPHRPTTNLVFCQPQGLQLLQLDDGEGQVTEVIVTQVQHPQARDAADLVRNVGEFVAAQ